MPQPARGRTRRRTWAALFTGSVLAVLSLTLLSAERGLSKKSFADREGKRCVHCHDNPNGGGPRNLTGLYYQATGKLPDGLTPGQTQTVVDRWLEQVAHQTPDVVWRYTPISALADLEAPAYELASDLEVLRRMSLDLRGVPPSAKDVRDVHAGRASLDDKLEEYLASEEFKQTFRLYHMDIIRPRTGIFNKPASLSLLREHKVGNETVFTSARLRSEVSRGDCSPENLVEVSPYWDRKTKVKVCRRTASEERYVSPPTGAPVDCATEEGQASGLCGCGPHLKYCYRRQDRQAVKSSMLQEMARVAMEVVEKDLPYSEIVTADWSMWNGRLDHFYARLDGRLGELDDPDVYRPFRRVDRDPRHSGVLTTHAYLNFFYNGRRWAQRTFESFLCHETWPDYDLLDEHEGKPPVPYRHHPTAAVDVNVNSGRACAACHLQLDGLARVKDRWDSFGQYYDLKEVPQTIRFLGEEVDGMDAFGRALAKSDVFLDCAVNQAWEHFVGHRFTPEEVRTRRRLLESFKGANQSFKALLRAIVKSDEYRAKGALKMMERELYDRSLERITGVKWRVGKQSGFDVFYDKVAGMDYRKIEERDRTPGQGHSLVQYKAAAESCDMAIERDLKRPTSERKMLGAVEAPTRKPSADELDAVLDDWYSRIYARPLSLVPDEEKQVMRELYHKVTKKHSPADGYKAVCTALLASADFALY